MYTLTQVFTALRTGRLYWWERMHNAVTRTERLYCLKRYEKYCDAECNLGNKGQMHYDVFQEVNC